MLSTEFRRIASRLLKTDRDDGINNLKRFIYFIENNPIIKSFIDEHNTFTFDIEKEIKEREMHEAYIIQPEKTTKFPSFINYLNSVRKIIMII